MNAGSVRVGLLYGVGTNIRANPMRPVRLRSVMDTEGEAIDDKPMCRPDYF